MRVAVGWSAYAALGDGMTHSFGFLPDPRDIHDAELVAHNSRALRRDAFPVPPTFTWAVDPAIVPLPRDQSVTSSCVGQALAASVEMRSATVGRRIVPSAKAIYDFARMVDTTDRKAPLLDIGCSPSRAIEGTEDYGLVSEERWPFSVADIDTKPPLDVIQAGADGVLAQHHRITPGRGACDEVRRMLANGFFPCFAMTVDEAYDRYDGSDVYRAPSGRALGRHYQVCVGYYEGGVIEVLNSWGTSWGRDGLARISEEVLESSDVTHWIVPAVLPTGVF